VIVDVDNQEHPVQIAARLVSLCGPAAKLIALGSANDVGLYRNMIAAGLTDYLVKPLTQELLTQAMVLATRGPGTNGAAKEAKTIVVMGVRGGLGASTIAVNVAWLIAHEIKRKCALLDLDLQFGTSALALDLEPGHGLRDVVSSPQRVDSLMIAGAMVSESDPFSVLSAEEPVDDIVTVDNAAVAALVKELRQTNGAVVVDLPRHLMPTQKRLLATAHEIVLVTEMSLVGIRDTLRVRTSLIALGATGRITLVATRANPQRSSGVSEADFAKGSQAKIDFSLPDDYKSVMAASNAGKTLGATAKGSALTKNLLLLAKYLVPEDSDEKNGAKKKGLKGWLGGGKEGTAK
ncbi:MAG: hypothetical protein HGA90_05360, partial [Alphaproteobacteria bacterium]|nr:hypothetical protein [Alphaproteobacteria bacterium]